MDDGGLVDSYRSMAPKPARAATRQTSSSTPVPGGASVVSAATTSAPVLTWTGELHATNTALPRANGACILDGHRLLCIGGWGTTTKGGSGSCQLSPFQALDLGTMTWSEIETTGEPHPAPSQFSAVDVGGALLFFGGWTGTHRINDLTLLQLDNASWSNFATIGDRPPALTFHSSSLVGKRMYIYGGNTTDSQSGEMHILDLQATAWGTAATLGAPPKRSSHTATIMHDHHIVIFGGRGDGASLLNDVAVFDASSSHWVIGVKAEGAPPPPRYGHSASTVGNSIVIFGGVGEAGKVFNDIWILRVDKPNAMVWQQVTTEGPSPVPRFGHYAVEALSAMYVVHGRTDAFGSLANSVWALDTSAVAPLPVVNGERDGHDDVEKASTTPGNE